MVKLQKIAIMPLAKIVCLIQSVVGVILALIVTLGSLINQQDDGIWAIGAWSLLVFPIVNALLGFVTGAFIAMAYNLFAQWIGPIEYEIDNIKENSLHL